MVVALSVKLAQSLRYLLRYIPWAGIGSCADGDGRNCSDLCVFWSG